jgi:hypothetical protein
VRQFDLDDQALEEVIEELVDVQGVARREENVLVWAAVGATPIVPAVFERGAAELARQRGDVPARERAARVRFLPLRADRVPVGSQNRSSPESLSFPFRYSIDQRPIVVRSGTKIQSRIERRIRTRCASQCGPCSNS